MDIIQMAREIGKSIQQEDTYLKLQIAKQNSDDDETLQALIGEFNLKRMAINNEASKSERNDEKLQILNKELRTCYNQTMENKHMIAYNEAKQAMDTQLQRIIAIITQSSEGDNPETTDYTPSCGGSCSTCGGCH